MGLSKDEAKRILVEEGWFHGHNKILREHNVSNEQAAQLKVGIFKLVLGKVLEAKAEIAKLQVAIGRMEAVCRAGVVPKLAEAQNAYSPDVWKLREEMRALDGWVISLLESDISLFAAIENPETAGGRVKKPAAVIRGPLESSAERVQADGSTPRSVRSFASYQMKFDIRSIQGPGLLFRQEHRRKDHEIQGKLSRKVTCGS